MLLYEGCHSIDSSNMGAILENVKFPNYPTGTGICQVRQRDRSGEHAMSHHSASFQAKETVSAEVVRELLPRETVSPEPHELVTEVPQASYRSRLRQILLAGTAVAMLAASAWYG